MNLAQFGNSTSYFIEFQTAYIGFVFPKLANSFIGGFGNFVDQNVECHLVLEGLATAFMARQKTEYKSHASYGQISDFDKPRFTRN